MPPIYDPLSNSGVECGAFRVFRLGGLRVRFLVQVRCAGSSILCVDDGTGIMLVC